MSAPRAAGSPSGRSRISPGGRPGPLAAKQRHAASWCRALAALGLCVAMLAGCRPGGHPAAERMPALMAQARDDTPRRALAAPATAAAAAATPTAEQLFDWAEHRYAELFPAAIGSANYAYVHEGQAYTVRSFGNGNHLGLTPDGRIYGLGPFTGQVLTAFGERRTTPRRWPPTYAGSTPRRASRPARCARWQCRRRTMARCATAPAVSGCCSPTAAVAS